MNNAQTHLKMGYVWTICLVAACGGLLFGYDWVVIGGAKPFYEAYFSITDPAQSGWAMSSALVGCVFGALASGWCADKFGRKIPLIIAAALFTLSAWGTALAGSFDLFVAWRIVGGLGIGLASALSPMYIAEISPAAQRGRFVAVNQLTIVIGVLAAQLVNLAIAKPVATSATLAEISASWNGQVGWRWMFGSGVVPALAFLILMFFVPESPRWLVRVGKSQRAHQMLMRIGNQRYADETIRDIEQTLSKDTQKVSWSALWQPKVRPIIVMGMVLAMFQQWCGINVIFNYAQEIFASAGFDINSTLKSIVATGLINLIFTIAALPLVDRIGRRRLMLLGAAGLTIIYALIAAAYGLGILGLPVLILVLAAIAIYALTLAPVTWVLLSEIFPNRVRGLAMSLGTLALWVACFLLTYTFPLLNAGLGASGSFLLYGVICAAGYLYILRNVPETKGVTLEALEEQLAQRHAGRQALKQEQTR
ncbi:MULTISPECIES: sugar porter family MFS transporter [Raoultella]|jgi:sugar porter (SP) family MFS transporter|uniref:D-xylose-proton symporter n=1 Tax=Raoultella terrigena TaxID=577 RepID=A0A4U9CZV9_RAOTE|nr:MULTISPECIES: sugar porter family MFS transporter [Raoultella]MCS4273827.1 sugar porter (SP) family MFS transporter [Raoultella sp. BIGb0132]MCS4290598.1 sugar porter (SP) family MFS transporter [Raoultella terrigena]MEB7597718.1 sugar porter family MFS transporter [Raoultella terrigena]NWK89932.1 sugar porter family MFS transporter [Raoultella terrigena]QPF09982.1 sugar porter family MFS transporter [Raoultella terrigena]